jgi:PHP family Zn ribbon phosphoesterase
MDSWFSALGSKSGFDSIEECYGDLTSHIHALETGLSSDPAMNWTCSFLDRYKLLSNSDAHSRTSWAAKPISSTCEMSYEGILASLRGDSGFDGTIEFFPQREVSL